MQPATFAAASSNFSLKDQVRDLYRVRLSFRSQVLGDTSGHKMNEYHTSSCVWVRAFI